MWTPQDRQETFSQVSTHRLAGFKSRFRRGDPSGAAGVPGGGDQSGAAVVPGGGDGVVHVGRTRLRPDGAPRGGVPGESAVGRARRSVPPGRWEEVGGGEGGGRACESG